MESVGVSVRISRLWKYMNMWRLLSGKKNYSADTSASSNFFLEGSQAPILIKPITRGALNGSC